MKKIRDFFCQGFLCEKPNVGKLLPLSMNFVYRSVNRKRNFREGRKFLEKISTREKVPFRGNSSQRRFDPENGFAEQEIFLKNPGQRKRFQRPLNSAFAFFHSREKFGKIKIFSKMVNTGSTSPKFRQDLGGLFNKKQGFAKKESFGENPSVIKLLPPVIHRADHFCDDSGINLFLG